MFRLKKKFLVYFQLKAAMAGKKDVFDHINIEWDLMTVSDPYVIFDTQGAGLVQCIVPQPVDWKTRV